MKFFTSFFLFNVLIVNAFNPYAFNSNTISLEENLFDQASSDTLKILFEKGIKEYSDYHYDKAVSSWNKVIELADTNNDSLLIMKANINIGSSYNALGYHKTALRYFLKSDKIFKDYKVVNEQYWINHINIGVCYMSLEQYDLAKHYFEKTKDYNPYIVFLKKLNLAKWYGLNNQPLKFISYQAELNNQVNNFPIYIDIWNEMQLEFFIKWKNKWKVKELLDQLIPVYENQNLFLKLQINQGYLLVYNKLWTSISTIIKYQSDVISSKDLYLTSLYYTVLKEKYYQTKDIEKYHHYSNLWEINNEVLIKEKNLLHVEDFKTALELEELKGKFHEIKSKNKIIENQLIKSNVRFRLSIVIIVMGISLIFLMIRNHKKNKKLLTLNNIKAQNDLLKKELEKFELSESLKEKSEELTASIINIKKVALLKKQLENIIKSNETQDEKEILRNLKVCLNSFFDNYRELNELIQKKLNVEQILTKTKLDYPNLTEKELKIIELIILQFTTKEIALLMGKSEKSIEYYRTQIRKKLKISVSEKLESYFI